MSIIERASRRLALLGRPAPVRHRMPRTPAVQAPRSAPPSPPVRREFQEPADLHLRQPGASPNRDGRIGGGRRIKFIFRQLERLGYITPDRRRSQEAEEFRLIKRRLLERIDATVENVGAGGGGFANLILVTSSRPKEGKTFTSLNLAMSIAMDERRSVLLVDGDILKPSLMKLVGLPQETPGLSDLLGEAPRPSLEECLWHVEGMDLSLLPPGRPAGSSSDLFAGETFVRLMAALAGSNPHQIVIFDSPPVLATNEPAILSRHAGQVVFVVNAGKTSAATIETALDLLEQDEKVSFVLNRSFGARLMDQFGSYYGRYSSRGGRIEAGS